MPEIFSEAWINEFIGTEEHELEVIDCDNYYFCCQDCPLEDTKIPADKHWSCYY
jgi:hypothetical protein